MKLDVKKIAKNIGVFIIVYAVIFSFYLSVSISVGTSGFYLHMRRFLLAALVCVLPYYCIRGFKLKNYLPELFLSLLWCIPSPVFLYISAKAHGASSLSMPYDVAIGAYLFGFLAFTKYILSRWSEYRFLSALYTGFLFLLAIIPCVNLVYYSIFKSPLGLNGTMAIYQTNVSEAMEYLSSLGIMQICMIVVVIVIALYCVKLNVENLLDMSQHSCSKKKLACLGVMAIAAGYYSFFSLIPRTHIVGLMKATGEYFESVERYGAQHDKIYENLHVIDNNENDKGTIIMVIGESATRNYMKAFNEKNDDTTPWLSSVKNSGDFILFPNAYSCAWNTVPALEHALTEANYYNNKEFNKSVSIVDVAKKSGYKTYWFSNQGRVGVHDTPITMVAETSDVVEFGGDSVYDEGLLTHLKKVNRNEKNFIVLHIMGSHIDYNNRYPKEYQIWTDPDHSGRVADYKNSLVYTDKFLHDVYEYSKANLDLKALVYFSDHGTDPNRTRDPDETRFIGLRVPLFVYLSPEYQDNHCKVVLGLKGNKEQFFSNDLVYDLMCGIFDIESENYDESNSLTSTKYKYDKNSVKAALGTKMVKDDPYLQGD